MIFGRYHPRMAKCPFILGWIALSVAFKLLEDITLGWTSSVAEIMGVADPILGSLVAFMWDWGLPMAVAAIVILLMYDYLSGRRQKAQR